MVEKPSTQAQGQPGLSFQILTPHTCPEGSAPDLEEEDITELEATSIPHSTQEENQRLHGPSSNELSATSRTLPQ